VSRGVWVSLGVCLSDMCSGFVGGVVGVWAREIVFATLVEGISLSVVCCPTWDFISTYAGPS
jgi:hypothetical protein